MKMHLSSTDYGNFLQNEPSPISTTTLAEKCTVRCCRTADVLECWPTVPLGGRTGGGLVNSDSCPAVSSQDKLVEEFNFLKVQAVEPMATFMEYIT